MASPNKKRPETWAKRFALNLKTTEDIRQKVEERAKKSGRSITLEVEQQLIKSFEIEEKEALNEEIKTEMRGTIAALEERIALMQEREAALWPDDSARALGKAFARAMSAARHVGGQDWREDGAASAIVAGVMRRLMDRCSRGGLYGAMAASLFDKARIAATADAIAEIVGPALDKSMPPLPPLQPQDNPANWTNQARMAMTFRDRATGKLLQLVTGPEFDIADPEVVRDLGPDYGGAVDRFRPIRDTVDAESFMVLALKDGSTAWESLSRRGPKVHVPAGQAAPPSAKPTAPDTSNDNPLRLIGEAAAGADAHNWRRARGTLPPEISDRAMFDEVMSDPRPDDGNDTLPAPPAKGGRRTKAPA